MLTRLPARRQRNSGAAQKVRSVPGHLAWVRGHGCSVPGCQPDADRPGSDRIEAAHVRRGTDGGASLKPHDRWAISLCAHHHRRQHEVGEASFERETGIDMAALARAFAARSPHRAKLDEAPL
ncbi:DUF968 domain-containing protein [Sphingomonas morindae]|uniref:DUF968 domain-containing protein n=1 Tax=Sphingomonas morindae TaxID=1541170 RepID=A0ABY4X460_9SPHN|nr:hypothetical protein [Sphingomonas morindae]USI71641.1 hypothetical protein LHA26_09865 [Sphingomonas morindae]